MAAPVADFSQAFAYGVFEKSYLVAGVFEFVDVGPDFGLPGQFVGGGFSATSTAGVKGYAGFRRRRRVMQFDEHAAHFLDLFVRAEDVFVSEKVSKAEFAGVSASARVWKGPYSARSCSVESQAIQKVSLNPIPTSVPWELLGTTCNKGRAVHNTVSNLITAMTACVEPERPF